MGPQICNQFLTESLIQAKNKHFPEFFIPGGGPANRIPSKVKLINIDQYSHTMNSTKTIISENEYAKTKCNDMGKSRG